MEELNIYTLFILSNQPTTQPAYQPKSEKCANFGIFQPIWLKFGMESKWKDSTHICDLFMFEHVNRPNGPITQLAYGPNFAIFQRICMKLCMAALNVKTYSFSELTGLAIFWSWRSYGIGDF